MGWGNRCADLAPPLAGDQAVSSYGKLWDWGARSFRSLSSEKGGRDQRDLWENAYHFFGFLFHSNTSFEVIGLDL